MAAEEFKPQVLLTTLVRHNVDFVLIGGLAAIAHGSTRPSFDIDVAYDRGRANLERLSAALRELNVTLRGAPDGLPFEPDPETIAAGAHFTFSTPYGSLDILSEPDGAPRYEELASAATEAEIEGVRVRVASIDHLIAMKETAARPHDKIVAAELRVISDELRSRSSDA